MFVQKTYLAYEKWLGIHVEPSLWALDRGRLKGSLWKQELSNTWTWSLFAGPDSLCWLPSIQYLPQDVHKTQGITKLNTTTCSLPDKNRSSRASNARHQKNQQALKRNKRQCRWQVCNKHIYCRQKENRVEPVRLILYQAIYSFKCAICL